MSEPVKFLRQLRPKGPWLLTAIEPDGRATSVTARDEKAVNTFVTKYDGRRNLYYSLNPARDGLKRKASKEDIESIEFVHADLDPRANEAPETAKQRYSAAIEDFMPKPSAIVDSGNGLQVLWRLAEPLPTLRGEEAEAVSLAVNLALGGTAGTQNFDRILRLPGTINIPNAKKLKVGRVKCPAKLVSFTAATARASDIATVNVPKAQAGGQLPGTLDWAKVGAHEDWLKSAGDLPADASPKLKLIVSSDGELDALNRRLKRAGLLDKPYASGSELTLALAAMFKRCVPVEKAAAALMCDLPCNRHITDIEGGGKRRRAVERALDRSHTTTEPSWRERRVNGTPLPSMHNARLAITALEIECRYDMFHNKMLFGYRGDQARHELQTLVGEVTDHGVIGLRQLVSERFGFDPEDKATNDAVQSLALEHCFDPVCDMLAEAQRKWDRIERLDVMAVTHFNCANTRLNRALLRKVMIAAVRRARRPGCKFDTIIVLESKEGWNKSSAWRILAGDENFSDESILGLGSREVQEQLAGVWIHENADLAGMRRVEVEQIKAFASRQTDRARPAFGRHVRKQPRRSIEVGTTNSEEYLQSQTGNRRFWPLPIRSAIDLKLLAEDRLQLWGEAAHYEAEDESIALDEKLWGAAAAEQEKRRVKDPWESHVANMPGEVIHKAGDREIVSTSDLLTVVLGVPTGQQDRRHSMKLAEIMKRAGWESDTNKLTINKKQVRGYWRWASPATREFV